MPWIAAVLFLLAYELAALVTGRELLTVYMVRATQAWPLLPFLAGLIVGGLAVHFWWRSS